MKLTAILLTLGFYAFTAYTEEKPFDPYAVDKSDPSASGLHDVGVIEDYDHPAGKPEEPGKKDQEDPCKALRKQKKEADKTKKEIADNMADACASDYRRCSSLRKTKREFDKKYPQLLEAIKEHGCED